MIKCAVLEPQTKRATIAAATALMMLGGASAGAVAAQDTGPTGAARPEVTAQAACATLYGKIVGGVSLTTAVVAANGATPAYCKVNGRIGRALNFEIRLPDSWNGKLYYGGGGGYDGSIPDLVVRPLAQGYAEVASDSGHQGSPLSAAFIVHNPKAARLFGSQSVPTVMASARKIITVAYGAPPSKSFFEGCSTGGREALMAVQRNPGLFNGVIARAPGYNWVGLMGAFNRTSVALAQPGAELTAPKLALLAQYVRRKCDALDGVVDGIVSNPAACTAKVLNIASLRCPGGVDTGDSCLSDAQLAVVRSWTSDAVYKGSSTYRARGYNLDGNEDDPMNFGPWAAGNGDVRNSAHYKFQDTTVKYYLARDPKADSLKYSPWDQNPQAIREMAALNDATQADIRPFIDAGGKLILWHGGSDAGLSVNSTIDYATRMRKAVGAQKADSATRLYIAPGVNHCSGGPGPDDTDLLSAIDNWVSQGVAPQTLAARKVGADGQVSRSLPLCVYPAYPRYTGPANDAEAARRAENYTCTAPNAE